MLIKAWKLCYKILGISRISQVPGEMSLMWAQMSGSDIGYPLPSLSNTWEQSWFPKILETPLRFNSQREMSRTGGG